MLHLENFVQHTDPSLLTRKDFVPSNEVRWCPACGDFAILAQVQKALPTLGIPKENFVFVSGIGCSSRFPYYMDTYGIHSIHGRAPAVATGLKIARPDLSVWVITGDGDALSIGGNHFIHALRRNVGLKVLLFNNQIYGLTKGQYSPTSEVGKKTKSTPDGSIDYPLEPIRVALGAGATFVARVLATDGPLLGEVLTKAAAHQGTAFVEIYQSCVMFNEDAFETITEVSTKDDHRVILKHGEPLLFGKNKEKGIGLNEKGEPVVIDVLKDGIAKVVVYDQTSQTLPYVLAHMSEGLPTPFGVFHSVEKPNYETLLVEQVGRAKAKKQGSVQAMLEEGESWIVE
jgi:2-oxoglutarate ferredoxin oxidoreductase subunit beta